MTATQSLGKRKERTRAIGLIEEAVIISVSWRRYYRRVTADATAHYDFYSPWLPGSLFRHNTGVTLTGLTQLVTVRQKAFICLELGAARSNGPGLDSEVT